MMEEQTVELNGQYVRVWRSQPEQLSRAEQPWRATLVDAPADQFADGPDPMAAFTNLVQRLDAWRAADKLTAALANVAASAREFMTAKAERLRILRAWLSAPHNPHNEDGEEAKSKELRQAEWHEAIAEAFRLCSELDGAGVITTDMDAFAIWVGRKVTRAPDPRAIFSAILGDAKAKPLRDRRAMADYGIRLGIAEEAAEKTGQSIPGKLGVIKAATAAAHGIGIKRFENLLDERYNGKRPRPRDKGKSSPMLRAKAPPTGE